MTLDLLRERLGNQRLTRTRFRTPGDVVAWLGAAQAQDYAGAKWGIGLRANGVTDADVEQAFNEGHILRTHVMRPTWHFVTPADIRWMQDLTAPRVHAASAHAYRKLGLTEKIRARSRAVIERALEGGTHLTRAELGTALRRARIPADGMRLAYLMMVAELDQVICSGPRRGNQSTYALLAERAPHARTLSPDEALAELTRRYFTSHGPATIKDFVWWSGLTVRQAKAGIEMVRPSIANEVVGELTYWFEPRRSAAAPAASAAFLLPNYDEYLIAYKDRGHVVGTPRTRRLDPESRDAFAHLMVIDGQFAGIWRRTLKADAIHVETVPYRRLSRADGREIAAAAERYGRFMNAPVRLSNGSR